MSDIEDRLRQATQGLDVSAIATAEVLEAVRQRHRRFAVGATAAAATVVLMAIGGGAALAVDHGSRPRSGLNVEVSLPSPTDATTSSPTQTADPAFPVLPAAPQPATAPEPATFYGAVGAGNERLAVVDSATGQVQRYLQNTGDQVISVFDASRTTAYQPSLNSSCGATWTAINLSTGGQAPAFADLLNPREVAVSPDGTRVAYTAIGAQQIVDGQPGGCPTATRTLIVLNRLNGQEISTPIGDGGGDSIFPEFDTSGNLLALKWHGHIQVLNLADGGSLSDAAVVPQPGGCDQIDPAFRPGTDQLMVATDCPNDAELDGYSLRDGNWDLTYRKVVADQPHSLLASYCFDASGTHLIYSVDVGESEDGAVYVAGANGDRHVADGIYQVCW
jgi:hypothetical protein